jgi:anti-sigma factor RsiW
VNERHVDNDLSAYLDGELVAADRTRVDAHLATCDRCAVRLGELRRTASLIAALPAPRAARSLVPRVTERYNWMRPLRSLSAVASGAFLFVFLITAVARSGTGLGGGGTTAIPAIAPAAEQATAANAPAASRGLGAATAPTAAPTAFAAPAAVPAPQASAAAGAQLASSAPARDTQKAQDAASAAPSPGVAALPPNDVGRTVGVRNEPEPRPTPLQEPVFWLILAFLNGALATVAHLRLRST